MTTVLQDAYDQLAKLYQYSGVALHIALFDDSRLQAPASFTVTTASSTITTTASLVTGCRVQVSSTGTLPAPLVAATDYYIVNNNQFALLPGGAAITLTSTGSGTHTIAEQLPNQLCPLSVWVRIESNYQGSARQPVSFTGATPRINMTEMKAYLDGTVYTFAPSTADIKYRWIGLIVDGLATTGNAQGRLRDVEDQGAQLLVTLGGRPLKKQISPWVFLT